VDHGSVDQNASKENKMTNTMVATHAAPEVDDAIHARRWAILAVLCLSLFLAVVDNTIVNVALPTLSRSLNAGTSELQWIVDAYSLVFAALLLVGGSLGDRFGRKGALQAGLLWFAVCSTVAAFTTSSTQLIAARALMGVGAALIFPATLAILTNVFRDPRERAKAIGAWSGVVGLAVALGPISGGILLRHFSWGSIFLVNLPVAAVALILGHRLVPTSKDPEAPRLDRVGFALSIVGIGLLVYTTIEAPGRGWASATTLVSYGVAVAIVAVFARWESRHEHPMLDVSVFRSPRFSAASASITLAFFAFFGFIFLITQYFQFVRGYDTLSAGLHTLPFAIAAGVSAPIGARLALRLGSRTVITIGLALMSTGFFYATTLQERSAYWGPVVISMVLLAIGLSLTTAPSTDAILSSLPPEKAGVGSAVNDTTRELGGTLGVAVIGSVFSSVYGPRVVDKLSALGVPKAGTDAARESVAAVSVVVQRAPAGARDAILGIARSSFMSGFQSAILVSAVTTAVAAVLAVTFLPSRRSGARATEIAVA
jgi:EmrB/QacA subfamily drug resistance transporter